MEALTSVFRIADLTHVKNQRVLGGSKVCTESPSFIKKSGKKLSRVSMCMAKIERVGSESVGSGAS